MQRKLSLAAAVLCGAALTPAIATGAESFKDVIIRNTADAPVPTRAIGTTTVAADAPLPVAVQGGPSAPEPVQITRNIALAQGERNGHADVLTVPEGKRFVLEHVAASLPPVEVDRPFARAFIALGDDTFPLSLSQAMPSVPLTHDAPIAGYAEAGEVVRVSVIHNLLEFERTATFVVVGHLVDAA